MGKRRCREYDVVTNKSKDMQTSNKAEEAATNKANGVERIDLGNPVWQGLCEVFGVPYEMLSSGVTFSNAEQKQLP